MHRPARKIQDLASLALCETTFQRGLAALAVFEKMIKEQITKPDR